MTASIEIYEHTGIGPTEELVYNSNWKTSGLAASDSQYFLYPIRRPEAPSLGSISYVKYHFAKITLTGSTTKIKRVRWIPEGTPGLNTRVFYGLFNTYTLPTDDLDGRLTLLEADTGCVVPRIGSSGPASATSLQYELPISGSPTEYYTEYLVTQMYVDLDAGMEIGNTDPVTWKLVFDEYHA